MADLLHSIPWDKNELIQASCCYLKLDPIFCSSLCVSDLISIFHFIGWITHSVSPFWPIGLQFPLHPWISIHPDVNINSGILNKNCLPLIWSFEITWLLIPASPHYFLNHHGWLQYKQGFQNKLSGGRSVEMIKKPHIKMSKFKNLIWMFCRLFSSGFLFCVMKWKCLPAYRQ